MAALRERLLQKLTAFESPKAGRIPASIVNGPADPKSRLPNTLSISFEGIDSGRLLADVRDQVLSFRWRRRRRWWWWLGYSQGGPPFPSPLSALARPPAACASRSLSLSACLYLPPPHAHVNPVSSFDADKHVRDRLFPFFWGGGGTRLRFG